MWKKWSSCWPGESLQQQCSSTFNRLLPEMIPLGRRWWSTPSISPLTTGVGVGGATVADEAAGFYVKLINQWRGNSLSWLTLIAKAGNGRPLVPFQPKPDTFVKPWTEGDPFIKRRSVPWHLQHPLKWRCITYFTRWMKRHPSLSRPYETLCS